MNVWQRVIDDELVTTHLGIAQDDITYENARATLTELIQWHVQVATDPAVNGGYVLVKEEQLGSFLTKVERLGN